MFGKRVTPQHNYRFIAVTEIEEMTNERQVYGKRTFRFLLADGSQEERTFEDQEWRAWQESVLKGGVVINPEV